MLSWELIQKVQSLAIQGNVESVIDFLNSITTPNGPIHLSNENELAIWNVAGLDYFVKEGKYAEAEKVYAALYSTLLQQQETLGRLHKGMALHNLALSFFYRGRIDEAIRFFVYAYIEDAISFTGKEFIEQLPPSSALRGLCGVPQSELFTIRDTTLEELSKKTPLRPEPLCELDPPRQLIVLMQQRYTKHIPEVWKWEIGGQDAFKIGDYKKSNDIYWNWFLRLLEYQKVVEKRVYKGYPLFHAGLSLFLDRGLQKDVFELFLYAFVEDSLSALNLGDARTGRAFQHLAVGDAVVEDLRLIEMGLLEIKKKGESIENPVTVLHSLLPALYKKTAVQSQDQWAEIMSSRDKKEELLFKRLSYKKEIDDQTDNTFYFLKHWNSSTPCYPTPYDPLATNSFGGGYFLIWNKLGIVIDPGYDFLELLYSKGFGLKNIDLIIITHAHDDHCQDLEAIFSSLHKLCNREKHVIDLVVSEATHIKYGRLLAISGDLISNEIMRQSEDLDPSKISNKDYNLTLHATQTAHNEEPWMKNNTGFGLIITLGKTVASFRIGLTSDTAYWDGMEKQFPNVNLLIEHIGTIGVSKNHLCHMGCIELSKKCVPAPNLVVISEFGEELEGLRETICGIIESSIDSQPFGGARTPVIAADIDLRIRLPRLQILCSDTKQFEDFKQVVDREVDGKIVYLRRE